MNIHMATPRLFARFTYSRFIIFQIKRCIRPLIAALILMFAGNAYAVITVGLAIENDLDSNGNITVINGSKVKVAYTVIEDSDKDLHKNDKIQLLLVSDDSIVDSVARGKKKSGSVSLKAKNTEGEQLYVRYIRKGSGTVIATAADQVTSIAKASLADLTIEQNALATQTRFLSLPGSSCFKNPSSLPYWTNSGLYCALSNQGGTATLVAFWPVDIPNGATILGLRGHVFTQSGVTTCRLRRGTNNSGSILATFTDSTSGWHNTAETALTHVVDTASNAYFIRCSQTLASASNVIGHIRIRYTTN